jgi:dCTP diphosphatase
MLLHVERSRLEALMDDLRAFVRERDWEQFHDPKNLAMLLASEVGELLAEYRWISSEDADAYTGDVEARARVEAELADVAISLLLLVDRLGLDLVDLVRRKVEANTKKYPADLVRGRSDHPDRLRGQG